MLNRRPKPGDNENDLFEFQKQFLASGSEPCAKVIKCYHKEDAANNDSNKPASNTKHVIEKEMLTRRQNQLLKQPTVLGVDKLEDMEIEMQKYDTHITAVLSEIVEKQSFNHVPEFPSLKLVANPQASSYPKKKFQPTKSNKRSLFAQQFHKKSQAFQSQNSSDQTTENDQINKDRPLKRDLYNMYSARLITGEGLKLFERNSENVVNQIHEENITKLSQMSSEDIVQEQHKLEESLDAKILAFLRKRSKKESATVVTPEEESLKKEDDVDQNNESSHSASRALQIDDKWLHMDKAEEEKMKWMEKIPPSTKNKNIDLPDRFDFTGRLLSLDESRRIPSHIGLHHHGMEPDLAGYTLQELLSLARSQFSQQQVFAFRTLAKVITKDKQGEHFSVIAKFVTPLLLEAGFPFILRWALDQRSDNCIQAAMDALRALLHPGKLQESFLDLYFLSIRGCEFPSFDPVSNLEEISSKDASDFQLVDRDLLKGFARMDLILRIRYVLEVCQPDPSVNNNCLEILQTCCQHSTELSIKVLECPRLIAFVVERYLPLVWPSDFAERETPNASWPNRNAIKLLRILCQAGRHATSRIIHSYSCLKTFLMKVFASAEEIPNKELDRIEIETWMFWTVCLSYGFYLDLYRELFPTLVLKMRKYAALIRSCEENCLVRIQYLLKAASAVVTNLRSDNTVEDFCLSWEEVKELYSITQIIINSSITAHLSNKSSEIKSNFGCVIAVGLNFLTICIERTAKLDDLETNVLPMILHLSQEVMKSADVLNCLIEIPTLPIISSLPDLKLSTFSIDLEEKIRSKLMNAVFLLSYLRCCVVMCRANRIFCSKFALFLKDWCEMEKKNEILKQEMAGFCNRTALHCIYWLLKLFVICVVEVPALRRFSEYFHSLSLSCLSSLGSGDEEYINDLLCNIVFHVDFFRRHDDPYSLASMLPSIRTTYMFLSACSTQSQIEASKHWISQNPQQISSFLLPSTSGSLLPADWPYLPIVHFYDKAIHRGEPTDSSTTSLISNTIKSCLCFLLFLEESHSDMWSRINVTAKITRLMCLYMAGSDLFHDEIVGNMMKCLFTIYTQPNLQSYIDFNLSVPGIVSFYDFYMSLLDQFDGVSYGDKLFSAVILMPVTACSKSNFKLALWAEHAEALRSISLTENQLLLSKESYLSPAEENFQVIRAYLSALSSGRCHPLRSPFLYELAIHHVGNYVLKSDDPRSQREIIQVIRRLPNEQLINCLLNARDPTH